MGSIYLIRNTVNGKSYIGQTRQDAEKTRIPIHLTGKGNQILKRAIEKYGKDAFTYEILHDGIIPEFLGDLEIEAIAKYNTVVPNGYNLTHGGEGGIPSEETRKKLSGERNHFYGKKHSPETRRKISEAAKDRVISEETRRKLSEARTGEKNHLYGKRHSTETRRKISEAGKGRVISEETRRKLSEAGKGRIPHNKGVFGRRQSKEACRKISEGQKGKKLSQETRRKISEAKEGKPLSTETRRKMSEAQKGKRLSPETRRKISESRKNPEHIAARAFLCSLSSDITTGEKRHRIYQKFPNIPRSTVYRWCKKIG